MGTRLQRECRLAFILSAIMLAFLRLVHEGKEYVLHSVSFLEKYEEEMGDAMEKMSSEKGKEQLAPSFTT
ncbi:unnamed protein product [Triticum turgidum subsp. durum]|uniref:Uncharacterized protein n=1 Tax=Triticum turgidum subsp. durum TaxID=4567 RepID=A0A9R1PY78_TRITD|nr:unnamed protein product [Triticum turgidum subsp. durum]